MDDIIFNIRQSTRASHHWSDVDCERRGDCDETADEIARKDRLRDLIVNGMRYQV